MKKEKDAKLLNLEQELEKPTSSENDPSDDDTGITWGMGKYILENSPHPTPAFLKFKKDQKDVSTVCI